MLFPPWSWSLDPLLSGCQEPRGGAGDRSKEEIIIVFFS
jgi:hypothetical protein